MLGIDLTDWEPVKEAVCNHGFRTYSGFLTGLENEHDGSIEVGVLLEQHSSSNQRCCMAVMAAAVHLAGNGGFVWNIIKLRDIQCVNIRPQANHLFPGSGVQGCNNTGAAETAGHRTADLLHDSGDIVTGFVLVHGSFRVHVNLMPDFNQFCF